MSAPLLRPNLADDHDDIVCLHGLTWAQFEAILEARGERAAPRITYLEGELELMRITTHRDARHDRLFVLGRFEVEERAFAEWSMGSLELSALRGQPLEGLNGFLRVGAPGLHVGERLVPRVLDGFRDGRYRRFVR